MGTINIEFLKQIFNLNSLVKVLLQIFFCILVIGVMNLVIFTQYVNKLHDLSVGRINKMEISPKLPLEERLLAKCTYTYCLYIKLNTGEVYKIIYIYEHNNNNNNNLKLKFIETDTVITPNIISPILTSNFNLKVDILNGNQLIINTQERIFLIFEILFKLYITISVVLFFFFYFLRYKSIKHENYNTKKETLYTEKVIKGNVTEMLHHELNAPLSILKVAKEVLHKSVAKRGLVLTEYEKEHIEGLDFSITRIDAIIDYLRQDKHFKIANNNHLFSIVDRTINDINILNVNKLKLHVEDKDKEMLSKYKLADSISTGSMLNILNIMCTNSMEANASKITASCNGVDRGIWLYLRITDNGKGIRDKKGNIFTNSENVITQYGYTSKEDRKETSKFLTWLENIYFKLFKGRIITTKSNRGIGLFMVKTILQDAGGYFKLIETNSKGTTFELKIPIQKM